MRNHSSNVVICLAGALLFSLPAAAQVYFPGGRSDEQKKAADESKATLKYDPHDLSGVWSHFGRPGDLPKYPGIGDGRPTGPAASVRTCSALTRLLSAGVAEVPCVDPHLWLGVERPCASAANVLERSSLSDDELASR